VARATTNHYDLIVLGTDFAGLVAAALVARRGKRVLLIPHGPIDGRYRLGRRSFALDTAPLVHLECPAVHRVLDELGLWTQIRRENRPLEDMLHGALPNARLDFEKSGERHASAWQRELDREWPDDPVADAHEQRRQWSEATDEVLDELLASDNALVADGFWSRRFLGRVAEQLPNAQLDELALLPVGHPMRAWARAVEPWLQHLLPAQLGKAASLRISRLWAQPHDRSGGAAGLREQLMKSIELKSGELKANLRIAEILHKRGRVTGISLLGKSDRYGCDHLMISTDPRRLIDGPSVSESLPQPLQISLANIETGARRYLLHLDIEERGLGPGFEGIVVCLPTGVQTATTSGVGHLYLRHEPGPSEGLRSLSIIKVIGPDDPTEDLRERVLDELDVRGILPFARPWCRLIHSPHDGREATDGAGRRLEALGGDTALRMPMDPLYRLLGTEPSLGVGMLPHSSGIKNLYFASRMTYPGLGLEGEFAAGWAAAGAVVGAGRAGLGRNLFLGRG
jgi:phytoene dehydrogenase-like protein